MFCCCHLSVVYNIVIFWTMLYIMAPDCILYHHFTGRCPNFPQKNNPVPGLLCDRHLLDHFRFVRLDPLLSDIALAKDDYRELLRWEDLMAAILAKMNPGYQVTRPGEPAQIKKGKLDPIIFNIASRSGNKKVGGWNLLQKNDWKVKGEALQGSYDHNFFPDIIRLFLTLYVLNFSEGT